MISPAIREDCLEIVMIDQICNPHPWEVSSLESAIIEGRALVWRVNKQVLAFIIWQTVCDESELYLLETYPTWQRQGIATQLLNHWLELEGKKGVERFFLEVRESNQSAIALYQKMGFQSVAKRKNYYTSPKEDALVMCKIDI